MSVKVGQIYRQKENTIPEYRKYEARVFVITHINMTNISAIDTNGKLQHIGHRWIEGDCEFIAEYPTWQEAIVSKDYKE